MGVHCQLLERDFQIPLETLHRQLELDSGIKRSLFISSSTPHSKFVEKNLIDAQILTYTRTR